MPYRRPRTNDQRLFFQLFPILQERSQALIGEGRVGKPGTIPLFNYQITQDGYPLDSGNHYR